MKTVSALHVMLQGSYVGELVDAPGRGIYFSYDPSWLANGFNLAPLYMDFSSTPQLAADELLFGGLPGAFSDSLPDGWGLLLMDRFFRMKLGIERRAIRPLDRLAYMGNRGMGALEYRPMLEKDSEQGELDLASLYQASQNVLSGETHEVIESLRLAGGSPGGARPKAVIGLSTDKQQAISSFGEMPEGYEHWLIKFRSQDEHRDSGAIEQAYAEIARNAGVEVSDSSLLEVQTDTGLERFFNTRRFDRTGHIKRHMLTCAAILYADFRMPSLDYGDLLRLTFAITQNAGDVQKMARLMVFNALAHNRDDHAKNFSFFGSPAGWQMAPAYDLTFANTSGRGNEHTCAFAGTGQPSRQAIRKVCEPFSFLEPELYIEQTMEALSKWSQHCADLHIDKIQRDHLQMAFNSIWKAF